MKTVEQLKARAKQLGSEITSYSKQATALIQAGQREEGHELMRKAYHTSKRCQVVIGEIIRMEKLLQNQQNV